MLNEFYARLFTLVARIREDEEGQGLAEYALILALVSILAVAALGTLSGGINGVLGGIGDALTAVVPV